MASDTDIAWCAGFFDGEGHVSYKRSYPNPRTGCVSPMLPCNVAQKSDNIEVLQFFLSVIPLGKITGPYAMPNGRPQHRLIFSTDEVRTVFEILRPYLKSEKTQAFIRALDAYENHDHRPTIEDTRRSHKRDIKKLRNT